MCPPSRGRGEQDVEVLRQVSPSTPLAFLLRQVQNQPILSLLAAAPTQLLQSSLPPAPLAPLPAEPTAPATSSVFSLLRQHRRRRPAIGAVPQASSPSVVIRRARQPERWKGAADSFAYRLRNDTARKAPWHGHGAPDRRLASIAGAVSFLPAFQLPSPM